MFILQEGSEREQRRRIAGMLRMQAGMERGMARRFADLLYKHHQEAIKAFEKGSDVEHGMQLGEEVLERSVPELRRNLEASWSAVFEVFGREAFNAVEEQLGGQKAANSQFELAKIRYLRKYGAEAVQGISNVTMREWRRLITREVQNGGGMSDVARALQKKYTKLAVRPRAWRIARTEVHSASVTAVHEAFASLNVKMDKKWRTTLDGRERASHRAANSHPPIPFDAKFVVGGEQLAYPGDRSGSAANIINCRCVVLYVPPKVKPQLEIPPNAVAAGVPSELRPIDSEDVDKVRQTYRELIASDDALYNAYGDDVDAFMRAINKQIAEKVGAAKIYKRTHLDTLKKLVNNDDEIKTVWKVSESSGWDLWNEEMQRHLRNIENNVLRIPKTFPNTRRPVYGYVASKPMNTKAVVLEKYGDVDIEFKTGIRNRTTAVFGDSAYINEGSTFGLDNYSLAKQLDELDVTSLPAGSLHLAVRMKIPARIVGPEKVRDAVDELVSFDPTDEFYDSVDFVEAHIYGELKVDDIAKVFIPSKYQSLSDVQRLSKKLKDKGVEVIWR